MKPTLSSVATLFVAGMMQAPSAPPMKMGLWEITTVAKMSGPHFPANMPAHTITMHACRTLDTYEDFFMNMKQHDCTAINKVWTSGSYKADLSCAGKLSGHVEVFFDNPEATHSIEEMDDAARAMRMNAAAKGRYLGADCGQIAPGKAVAVQVQ